MKPYEDGEVRREYWCSRCGRIAIDQRSLDGHLGDWAVRTLADPNHADVIEREERERGEARRKLEAEADAIERTATEIAARLGRGEMPLARYDAIVGPLDGRLAAIRTELTEKPMDFPVPAPSRTIPPRDRDHIHWLMEWGESPRAVLQQALGGRTIIIGPGKPGVFDTNRVQIT